MFPRKCAANAEYTHMDEVLLLGHKNAFVTSDICTDSLQTHNAFIADVMSERMLKKLVKNMDVTDPIAEGLLCFILQSVAFCYCSWYNQSGIILRTYCRNLICISTDSAELSNYI